MEVRDTSPDERALTEVNSGIYVFRPDLAVARARAARRRNDQGELYLTDVGGAPASATATRVAGHLHADPTVALGINTRADLAAAAALLRARINLGHMLAGVTIVDPASTLIEPSVTIAADATIEPFTVLRGATMSAPARGRAARRRGRRQHRRRARSVGPFCYLRPGAELADGAKAGTFVEIKNSQLGEGAKVPHLSYIGDA